MTMCFGYHITNAFKALLPLSFFKHVSYCLDVKQYMAFHSKTHGKCDLWEKVTIVAETIQFKTQLKFLEIRNV